MSENIQTVTTEGQVDETPPVVVGSEPSAEPSAGQPAEPPQAQPPAEPGKDETPPWMKREITIERNKRREAQEEARILREQVDRLTKAIEPKPQEKSDTAPKRPKPSDFFDPAEYDAALDEYQEQRDAWILSEAEKRVEAKTTRTSEEQARARYIEETKTAWSAQVTKAQTAHPDFEDVVYADDFLLSEPALQALVKEENGAEIGYAIASDEAAKARFSSLSPVQQIVEIGRMAATLASPRIEPRRAPEPIRPLGNEAPAVQKSAAEESEAEYMARRTAEARANRERLY